ncbi:hypothetical protein [Flavobacterium acetivorans]|uniref:hypothetical protein n=1 Tax=Flavobacterium acetivorans TaxID=2893883 RepID=UPI001E298C75|nr:hypothetical protein [Flavobacterium sp. F-29]UFH36029.1 hypothetical protein LNP19_03065 [Flavobacterium sp. F-29]
MKKKLEADLISIAHRILQLKNKSDINQLYLETQKLYEKLSVLRFVDTHYGDVKPTIGYAEIEKEIESFFEKDAQAAVEEIEITQINLATETTSEETVEKEAVLAEIEQKHLEVEEKTIEAAIETNTAEEILNTEETLEEKKESLESISETDEEIDAVALSNEESLVTDETIEDIKEDEEEISNEKAPEKFKAAFELSEEIETPAKPEAVQISFEDLLGGNYNNTLFVKVDEVEAVPTTPIFDAVEEIATELKKPEQNIETKSESAEPKSLSLNDKLAKGINIDLNDQIAFVKHLFGNSNEDYNRVLNQLITFDNFYETRNFIEEMVKPDYNNWEGKADYEERFMDIIEKKFL